MAKVDLSDDEILILIKYYQQRLRKSPGTRPKAIEKWVERITVLRNGLHEEINKPMELRVISKAW